MKRGGRGLAPETLEYGVRLLHQPLRSRQGAYHLPAHPTFPVAVFDRADHDPGGRSRGEPAGPQTAAGFVVRHFSEIYPTLSVLPPADTTRSPNLVRLRENGGITTRFLCITRPRVDSPAAYGLALTRKRRASSPRSGDCEKNLKKSLVRLALPSTINIRASLACSQRMEPGGRRDPY